MTPNPHTAAVEAVVAAWLDTLAPEARDRALFELYERLRWRIEHGLSTGQRNG